MRGVRAPLAIKVFLAFVAVIGAGLIPIRLGLRTGLREVATQRRTAEMEQRARQLVDRVAPLAAADIARALTTLSPALTERLTWMTPDGRVQFDTAAVPNPDNHVDRPEVQQALAHGVGLSERVSDSDGVAYLYVAVTVPGTPTPKGVLRLAAPQTSGDELVEDAANTINRGAAWSLSLALLLSLVAVYAMVRPLRRMRDAASRLAQGEMSLTLQVNTGDELEELARALETVGAQLRSRLLAAGSGEALVGQMVHAMVQGVVVLDPDGKVQHINGVARAKLGLRGPRESERLTHLLSATVVRKAMEESVMDPLGVDIRVPHPVTGEPIDGVVVALRRPHGQPLHALILDVQHGDAATLLDIPELQDVAAVPLDAVMQRVLRLLKEADASHTFLAPDEWPTCNLVDAGERVEGAVKATLRAAAEAAARPNLALSAHVQDHEVCIRLPVAIPAEVVALLQPRISPLGGRVQSQGGRVELWLPLA